MEEILKRLSELHYAEEIDYYQFVDSKRTDNVISKQVAELFDQSSWENCIVMLYRIQQRNKSIDPAIFHNFWNNLLVYDNDSRAANTALLRSGLFDYDAYLRTLVTLVTGNHEHVARLQTSRSFYGMKAVVDLCRSKAVNLFNGDKSLIDIIETLRCYRNGSAHYPVEVQQQNEKEELSQEEKLVLPLKNNRKDDEILDAISRLMIVGLLLIIKYHFSALDERIPKLTTVSEDNELDFHFESFLERYFASLKNEVDTVLAAQAIPMFKDVTDSGYLEHTIKYRHGSDVEEDDDDEQFGNGEDTNTDATNNITTGINDDSHRALNLSQFYVRTKHKTNVLLGMPGAGKSTALRLILRSIINQYFTAEESKEDTIIPIYIKLNEVFLLDINKDPIGTSVKQIISKCIINESNRYQEAAIQSVFALMKKGQVLLLFDGLNEIPAGIEGSTRNLVIASMTNFIREYLPKPKVDNSNDALPESESESETEDTWQNCKAIITCRKYEYERGGYSGKIESIPGGIGIWHLEGFSYEKIEKFLPEDVNTVITRRGIENLFTSPLNIKLFLELIRDQQASDSKSRISYVPYNRAEIIDGYIAGVLSRDNLNVFYANSFLKVLAVELLLGKPDRDSLKLLDPHFSSDLIDKLASYSIIAVSPASEEKPEELSFYIDTFHEFFRAKFVLDTLKKDKNATLSNVRYKDKDVIDVMSEDDYETLKLIMELGSSEKSSTHKDTCFSARLAVDYISYHNKLSSTIIRPRDGRFKSSMVLGEHYYTLCKLVSNVNSEEGSSVDNAKTIAKAFVLNNLRLYRVTHPTPQQINKREVEYSYLYSLMAAAAYISDDEIFSEVFSSYWLFTFCVLSPNDWGYTFHCGRIEDYYSILSIFFINCKRYCELYDKLHKIHVDYILRKKESAVGIGRLINQFFLCFIPQHGKKLLLNHLLKLDSSSKKEDGQLKADINSLLCYIGDGDLLSKEIRYGIKIRLRIREIRYLLRHYSDSLIQQTLFTPDFFRLIDDSKVDIRSFVIRFYLFRLGMTPILKRFLFDNDYINSLPQNVRRTITDIIPLKSIPRTYAESKYDRDVYELLLAKSGGASPGESIVFNLFLNEEDCTHVAIEDVQEETFRDKTCHIKNGTFQVTDDRYEDTFRLYCEIKSQTGGVDLLPKYGSIITDSGESIPYFSASPDTTLKFYLYGERALKIFAIYTLHQGISINDIPCDIVIPELDSNPVLVLRRIRVLTLVPRSEFRYIPYSGLLSFDEEVLTSPSSSGSIRIPERYYDLRIRESVKSDSLPYQVFGMDKSSLWIISEKIVTAPSLLIGSEVSDNKTKNIKYSVQSVSPFNHAYLEIRFSSSRKLVMPKFGTVSCVDKDGNPFSIRYCYCLSSDDRLSHLIRVFDERALEDVKTSIGDTTFRYGNISLLLTSYEVIRPNRKYSIWHLHTDHDIDQSISPGGEFSVWDGNHNNGVRQITVSGETRTSIPSIQASLLFYSNETGDLLLSASNCEGKIGAGQGDINLLKGLYLHNPLSTMRFLIDKESILDVYWAARFQISFLRKDIPQFGRLRLGESALNYVYEETSNVLRIWASKSATDVMTLDEVNSFFRNHSSVELITSDGTNEIFDILPEKSLFLSEEDCSMVIHSSCKSLSPNDISVLKGGDNPIAVNYNLQALSPVCNSVSFQKVFSPLLSKSVIPYIKHAHKEGTIIIPKPVSEIQADFAVINNLRWNISEIGLKGDSHIQITLTDRKGSIPRLEQRGTVCFVKVKQTIRLWYKHLYNLIEPSRPERYHSEICDTLLEEVRLGYTDIGEGLVNFFVAKSRSSDLVSNDNVLKKISTNLPYHRFNVCRVTAASIGIEVYSPLRNTEYLSSDTEPASHDGRSFAWADLVLFEENHRVSFVDDSTRYPCLGFKEGFIVTIDNVEEYGDRKQALIYCIEDNRYYKYYYSSSVESELSLGQYVSFFATVNYNDGKKLSAEKVRIESCEVPPVDAELVKKDSSESHLIFTFLDGRREIVIKLGKTIPIISKMELLKVGMRYKLIRGQGNRYIIAF